MGDNQEKLKNSEIKLTSSNKFLNWLENFWFHHKWKIIIVSFFAIVLIVGLVQCMGKEKHDIEANITIATHTIYYKENVQALESDLRALMPTDSAEKSKNVTLTLYKIYSEEEMNAANSEKDGNDNPIIVADPTYNKSQMQEYNSYIMTGECTVMILSEYLYEELVDRRTEDILLKPMSEIFGEDLPAGVTEDGYGIKLTETGAYKNLDSFKFLPKDSVICIMRPFALRGDAGQEKHEYAVEYFKDIIEFGN